MTQKKEALFSNVESPMQVVRAEGRRPARSRSSKWPSSCERAPFRTMQGTSQQGLLVHPRLALLEATLSRAADDLWHTVLEANGGTNGASLQRLEDA